MQFDAAHIIRRTNERLRHDADAKTRFCHWDDLVSRGGFDGGLKSNALRGENRDVERMGGRARAERDEWIRFQLGKRDASSKQTGKGRRADRNLPNSLTIVCVRDGESVTGVVMTAKSAVVSCSAATACGVEWLLMRRCTPGYFPDTF